MNRISNAARTFVNNHPIAIVAATTVITAVTCAVVIPRLEKNLQAQLADLANDPSNDI